MSMRCWICGRTPADLKDFDLSEGSPSYDANKGEWEHHPGLGGIDLCPICQDLLAIFGGYDLDEINQIIYTFFENLLKRRVG